MSTNTYYTCFLYSYSLESGKETPRKPSKKQEIRNFKIKGKCLHYWQDTKYDLADPDSEYLRNKARVKWLIGMAVHMKA